MVKEQLFLARTKVEAAVCEGLIMGFKGFGVASPSLTPDQALDPAVASEYIRGQFRSVLAIGGSLPTVAENRYFTVRAFQGVIQAYQRRKAQINSQESKGSLALALRTPTPLARERHQPDSSHPLIRGENLHPSLAESLAAVCRESWGTNPFRLQLLTKIAREITDHTRFQNPQMMPVNFRDPQKMAEGTADLMGLVLAYSRHQLERPSNVFFYRSATRRQAVVQALQVLLAAELHQRLSLPQVPTPGSYHPMRFQSQIHELIEFLGSNGFSHISDGLENLPDHQGALFLPSIRGGLSWGLEHPLFRIANERRIAISLISTAFANPFLYSRALHERNKGKPKAERVTGADLRRARVLQTSKLFGVISDRIDDGSLDFTHVLDYIAGTDGSKINRLGLAFRNFYNWADEDVRELLLNLLTRFWGHPSGANIDLVRQIRERVEGEDGSDSWLGLDDKSRFFLRKPKIDPWNEVLDTEGQRLYREFVQGVNTYSLGQLYPHRARQRPSKSRSETEDD